MLMVLRAVNILCRLLIAWAKVLSATHNKERCQWSTSNHLRAKGQSLSSSYAHSLDCDIVIERVEASRKVSVLHELGRCNRSLAVQQSFITLLRIDQHLVHIFEVVVDGRA